MKVGLLLSNNNYAAEKAEKENNIRIKLLILKAAHFLITTILFYWAFLLFRYRGLPQVKDIAFRYNYFVTLGFAIFLAFFNRTYCLPSMRPWILSGQLGGMISITKSIRPERPF